MSEKPFTYQFRRTGGTTGLHCSYCPKQPNEPCPIACATNYEKIQAERAKDGVVVNDEP